MAWVKTQKLCHNCPTIYLFSWEREGNPYTSNPIKNFKILQSALSDQPLQHTSLDPQCVCDAPLNCPILQKFHVYSPQILHLPSNRREQNSAPPFQFMTPGRELI